MSGFGGLFEFNMDGESEICSVKDLEVNLVDVMLALEEIVPVAGKEWLEKVVTSHGTRNVAFKCININKHTHWKEYIVSIFDLWGKGEPFCGCNHAFRFCI